jgi:hypothetical protein
MASTTAKMKSTTETFNKVFTGQEAEYKPEMFPHRVRENIGIYLRRKPWEHYIFVSS